MHQAVVVAIKALNGGLFVIAFASIGEDHWLGVLRFRIDLC